MIVVGAKWDRDESKGRRMCLVIIIMHGSGNALHPGIRVEGKERRLIV